MADYLIACPASVSVGFLRPFEALALFALAPIFARPRSPTETLATQAYYLNEVEFKPDLRAKLLIGRPV